VAGGEKFCRMFGMEKALTTSSFKPLHSSSRTDTDYNQSRIEQPHWITNHSPCSPCRIVADPATHYIQHQGMIGHGCSSARPVLLAHFLPMGGYGDVPDEPQRRGPRIELQMSPAATVVEWKRSILFLGVFESPTNLQAHVGVVTSISYGHDPAAMNLLFQSFLSSPTCVIFS
jgi:hypothetical protein